MDQLNLFSHANEKGSREWHAFNMVRDDRVNSYRVMTPRKPETPRYGTVVPIKRYRYPHQLFLKGSH